MATREGVEELLRRKKTQIDEFGAFEIPHTQIRTWVCVSCGCMIHSMYVTQHRSRCAKLENLVIEIHLCKLVGTVCKAGQQYLVIVDQECEPCMKVMEIGDESE